MAWRVVDARHAFEHAVKHGAEPYTGADKTLDVPAIKGIGGSLLYFVDNYGAKGSAYDAEFEWLGERDPRPEGVGFYYLDHLTHNVYRGNMDKWFGFYAKLFNFRQIRFFDIEGKLTGLHSRALTSPVRQDPHPDQRVDRRQEPDRGIPQEATRARASSTSRSATENIYDATDALAANGVCSSCRARPTPTTRRASSACRAMPSRSRACSATAS